MRHLHGASWFVITAILLASLMPALSRVLTEAARLEGGIHTVCTASVAGTGLRLGVPEDGPSAPQDANAAVDCPLCLTPGLTLEWPAVLAPAHPVPAGQRVRVMARVWPPSALVWAMGHPRGPPVPVLVHSL